MAAKKIRRQPPVKGGRIPLSACLREEITDAIRREAELHGVSRSWIQAVILADALGITVQEHYIERRKIARVK